ncbi:MAG: hypothetical protein LUD01_07010 [Clostridiales bacterium]|nr:hypothetical protein [Clostridiales bacterium]
MRLIKLPFKMLAVIAVLALTIFILIAKLISRLSSFVMGLLLLILIGCALYCVFQSRWQDLAILAGMGLVVVAFLALLTCAEVFAERCRSTLGTFIRS